MIDEVTGALQEPNVPHARTESPTSEIETLASIEAELKKAGAMIAAARIRIVHRPSGGWPDAIAADLQIAAGRISSAIGDAERRRQSLNDGSNTRGL